ncbi:MAG TPA: type II secretion system F family protein, partial [Firmicutes bacterium]|nr:type II secretion system F family protein [Bacillota bacterium]
MLRVWGFGIMQRLQRLSFLQQRRPGVQDFMTFSQQFAAMLAAGIPVLTGLEILGEQTESRWLRNGIKAAARRVEQGNTLTEALQQEGKLFSPFFLGMIEAGEAAGILDQTMQRLALHFKNRHDLEQKIRTATIYPKFVFLFILGVAAFLLTFIVPAFADTFQGMGAKIPLPTRLLIVMGKGLRTYWYLLFLAGIVFYLLYLRVAKTKKGVFYLDWLRLRLPLFGHLYYKMMLAQFCQIFSAMLGSGVDILRALDLLKNVVNNSVFHERIQGI